MKATSRTRTTLARRLGWLIAGQILLSCPSLEAQEVVPDSGARVRVNQKVIGSFVSWDANELVLSDTALVLAQVTTLELSRGRKSNAGKGALIGGLVGAAAGATYGLVLCEGDCEAGSFAAAAFVGLVGAGAGALIGLVIGSVVSGEHWEEVPLVPVHAGYLDGEAAVWLPCDCEQTQS